MSEPIFKLRNVSKFFGRKIVLNNISLDIHNGEIFGVIGASGSGKTTLLNTLIGYYRPERGDVLFRHKESRYTSIYARQSLAKKMFGFASQEPSYYNKLTVKENLAYFGSLYGLSSAAIQKNSRILIDLMDLRGSEHVLSENLSGGMERRLDIACALIHNPPVIILDEPTADLDPYLCEHIHDIIKTINSLGTTVIISSHRLIDMERLCMRIAILSRGKLLVTGSPEEIRGRRSKGDVILIESYPGEYTKIQEKLAKDLASEIVGTHLRITTTRTPEAIKDIITLFEKAKEDIIDLRIIKPSLEDVFITLLEEAKGGAR
ncbi:MAG: ABC transporter ATP-binding protein [Nanoarchaeota archaeon]